MNKNFRDLLHIALGKRNSFERPLTDAEWGELYAEAEKQSLIGVCFAGIERLPKEQLPNMDLMMEWLGQTEYIKTQNDLISQRAADVTKIFAEGGFRSVVLKGQGVAQLYKIPCYKTNTDNTSCGQNTVNTAVEETKTRKNSSAGCEADASVANASEFSCESILRQAQEPLSQINSATSSTATNGGSQPSEDDKPAALPKNLSIEDDSINHKQYTINLTDLRTSGDIDLWVDGKRDEVIRFLKGKGYNVGKVFVHHIDVDIFDDATVEVHIIPSFSYSPFRHRKYLKWFRSFDWNQNLGLEVLSVAELCESEQVRASRSARLEIREDLGFNVPSIGFNLVYSLLHIFRHVFHEGIGLRQLMDYYFILQHATEDDRQEAMKTIRWMGLERFAGAVMFVEQEMFAVEETKTPSIGLRTGEKTASAGTNPYENQEENLTENIKDDFIKGSSLNSSSKSTENPDKNQNNNPYPSWLLCEPEEKAGMFLLEEIMQNGNFGHYNEQTREAHRKGSLQLYLHNVRRLFKMLKYYPSEVLWSPIWKPCHWMWRKWNQY